MNECVKKQRDGQGGWKEGRKEGKMGEIKRNQEQYKEKCVYPCNLEPHWITTMLWETPVWECFKLSL